MMHLHKASSIGWIFGVIAMGICLAGLILLGRKYCKPGSIKNISFRSRENICHCSDPDATIESIAACRVDHSLIRPTAPRGAPPLYPEV